MVKKETFHFWLKRFIKEDNRFGDLARDVYSDNDALKVSNSFKAWESHLFYHGASSSALDVLEEAWTLYKN